MARLIPASIDDSTPQSERDVLELFKRDLPPNWLILHGQRVTVAAQGTGHVTEVELDIVVIDPRRGLLCIEVKGGEVVREAGEWYSTNRRTKQRHTIKDPGKQALAASHSLAAFLRSVPDRQLPGGCPPFAWAVALPDVAVSGGLGADLPRELVIGKNDLRNPTQAIDRAFAHSLGTTSCSFDADAVVSAIAPDFKLVPLLRSHVDDQEAVLVRLTQEQLDIVDGLDAMSRVAVQGPAGTGKTLVASARAARLAARGARVLMLCYNSLLADHLSRSARGFAVHTFHSLCHHLCNKAEVPFAVPQGPELQQRFFDQDCAQLLERVLDVLPQERYDAVIVDEGQDFRPAWWPAVQKLLRDPNSGHLWVFWDPHQNIFNGEADVAERLGLPKFQLSLNCRNSRPIAEFAYGLVGATPKLRAGAPDSPEVHQVRCSSPIETQKAVTAALDELVGGGLKPEQIVVLSPRGTKTSAVWKNRPLGRHRLEEFDRPSRTGAPDKGRVISASNAGIRFGTLQSFKGLEADAVILCEVQKARSPEQLYVAASKGVR
ncbi:MAG TPA: AAA family ATPase [Vicinamibacterales bacterium]|nr:AAA family ATPase [Vicinamibacterales bacterium]